MELVWGLRNRGGERTVRHFELVAVRCVSPPEMGAADLVMMVMVMIVMVVVMMAVVVVEGQK